MRIPTTRPFAWTVLTSLALLVAGSAAAQVSSSTQACIQEINKGARKVLVSENQAIASCVRSFTKGTLSVPTVELCAAPATSAKVQKAMTKAVADASKRCPGGPPSFGPPSVTGYPPLAVAAGAKTLSDIFGPNVETSLLTDGDGSKCQDFVLKALHKCEDTRLKEFLNCKKGGLKSGAITDASSLQSQCLGTGPEQPDPKARIAIACQYKLEERINTKCLDEGVALAQAFPACGTASGAALTDCLDARARCRSCALLNGVDGLAKDCDVADDGNDANQSCPEPTTCGDLFIDGLENCEDGDAQSGDGCSASCQLEPGWLCSGFPTVCTSICGDGLKVGTEGCDDGDLTPGDGCNALCQVEIGYSCSGSPSVCNEVCGDGRIVGEEDCDDGDATGGDGCSSVCEIEGGYSCVGQPSVCTHFDVVITSPTNGSFSTSSTATVTGVITNLSPALAALTVNGASVPVALNGTFSTVLAMSASAIFNPIEATVVDTLHGGIAHDRVVRVRGSSIADGAFSPQSVALRLNDSGLNDVEPLVADLAGDGLNLADLVPVGTTLVDDECFIDTIFGCIGSATVKVSNPPPSIGGFGLQADSMTDFVAGDITVSNIRVNVFLDGSGLVPDCPITIRANQAFFFGDYTLSPDALIPSNIDVNQLGPLQVSFSNFTTSFGGLCDAPIIGDIIQAFLPDVEALTIDAMADFLDDPDGAGPQDSPTAGAIEEALAGISITGPIGEGLGVLLETPLFTVAEDTTGITLGSNSRITTTVGSGAGQCIPPVGAPNLAASLAFAEVFPTFGANTPVSHVPYDVAISISAEGFNQLLRAQTECGLLVTSLNEIDIGFGPLPLNAGILTVLMPEFALYPPATPFRIDIRPTLAPIVTGAAGPAGELTELRVSNVLGLLVRDDGSEEIALAMAFDAAMGMDLAFTPGALGVVLTPPAPESIVIAIIDNPLDVEETTLETGVLPSLLGSLLPDLSSSLSSFPLPDFLGLSMNGVEVSRTGLFLALYANLQPSP